jgi:cytidylate kinase
MEKSKITIAVDGYAACGKSTLAKALAKRLGYVYVDSGAMYRAVTLYFLNHDISIEDHEAIDVALQNIHIHFENIDGKNNTFLNDENVEEEVRSMRISNFVSPVATVSAVREKLVEMQHRMGAQGGIAMDGRDIGTVVFKDAELKIFLTASIQERTRRRLMEWEAKGITDITAEEVKQNLLKRDHIDSTRKISPLCQAEDAIEIDNTSLTPDEQLNYALELSMDIITKKVKGLELAP